MAQAFRESLGLLLKDLRVRRGFTLEQVRDLTAEIDWPISRSRLSDLERGAVELKASDIFPLSRVYGCAVAELVSEAITAHSQRRFAQGKSASELFEEGKALFTRGQFLRAAWAFDEAARRANDTSGFRHLCHVSAAHCYERDDAFALAIRRIESVLDDPQAPREMVLRALGKAALLSVKTNALHRTRLYLREIDDALATRLPSELRAYLISYKAESLYELGEFKAARPVHLRAAKLAVKNGSFDMAAKSFGAAALCCLEQDPPAARMALRYSLDGEALVDNSKHVECSLLISLCKALAQTALGEHETAHPILVGIAPRLERLGFEREARKAHTALYEIARNGGRPAEASRWLKKQRRSIERPTRGSGRHLQ